MTAADGSMDRLARVFLLSIHITNKLVPEMLEQHDEIPVLKNGRIEERGAFRELTERKEYFCSLCTVSR